MLANRESLPEEFGTVIPDIPSEAMRRPNPKGAFGDGGRPTEEDMIHG
jgi:hypothetical protein